MSDKILVKDNLDSLTPTRVHDRFQDRGHEWAVTESIDAFSDYVVTHVATGRAVPFSTAETPEGARKAYLEGIDEYDQETVDELVGECDEIPDKHICPRCEGDGVVDEDQQEVAAKVRELEDEVEQLRAVLKKIAAPMAGSADRKTWQGLAEYRAQIAANALDGGGGEADA